MGRYRLLYVISLVGSAILYMMTNQRQSFILLLFLLFVGVFLMVTLLIGQRSVHVDFFIRDVCVVGQKCPADLKIDSKSKIPVGCIRIQFLYENVLFKTVRSQDILLEPPSGKTGRYELPFTSEDCGKIKITVKKAVCYDILGIFSRKINFPINPELIVYPELYLLDIVPKNHPEAKSAGDVYHAEERGQDVTEVFDMRDYQEGDNIKSIHWKLSGKLDRLVIREFSNPSNYHTVLFYDFSWMQKGQQEAVRQVCNGILGMVSSVSKGLMEQGQQHHVMTWSQKEYYDVAVKDRASYFQMMQSVLIGQWSGDTTEPDKIPFLQAEIEDCYSKMILVTGKLNETVIRWLSDRIDLTVLYLREDGTDRVENGKNYSIITIPVAGIKDKLRILEI